MTAHTARYKAVAAAALVLLLASCASSGNPTSNKDPRKGRVTITWSNCGTGACIYDWKICIGPDLFMHVDDAKPADHTIKDSRECTS